jgi:hypothetical protein
VLGRKCVDRDLVDQAKLLGVVEEGPGIDFQQIAQFSHSFAFVQPRRRYVAGSSFVTEENDAGLLQIPLPIM